MTDGTPGGKRTPEPRPRARRGFVAAGVAAAGVAGALIAIALWPGPPGSPEGGGPGADRTDGTPAGSSSPAASHPLSGPPRTVPAVREHTPARGPGWRPGPGGRVLVRDRDLADEARLLAGELGMDYGGVTGGRDTTAPEAGEPPAGRGAQAGPGDVELALAGSGGAPESYTLSVRERRVLITGADQAGAFYGTRTLKQAVRGTGTLPEGTVRDRPAKPQRGLMLDTARKHYSARWIEDRLRELADLKFNQFGLHFSDDQGFRIESGSHPEIVSADHLTKAEVRRILALAERLHITVIPEIDSPGHLGAVIRAHPSLQLRTADGTATRGAIDIGKPAAARIVDDLLREYARLFPGPVWHLGGDEYRALTARDPEAAYPRLAELARERHGSRARVQDLATAWLNDRQRALDPYDKTTVKVWNDGLFRGGVVEPDRDREVEYWTGKEYGAREPQEYLDEGWKVVNLNDEYLYYVLGEPQTFRYPTGQRIYEEWSPLVLRGSKPVAARHGDQILGARLAVWCDLASAQTPEQVARGIRLPLAALSQRVWDERRPEPSWEEFQELAEKLG